jgi:hypothetical protein
MVSAHLLVSRREVV